MAAARLAVSAATREIEPMPVVTEPYLAQAARWPTHRLIEAWLSRQWHEQDLLRCDICRLTPLPGDDVLITCIIDHALTDPSITVRHHSTVALGGCQQDARRPHAGDLGCPGAGPSHLCEARQTLRRRQAHQQTPTGSRTRHHDVSTQRHERGPPPDAASRRSRPSSKICSPTSKRRS